MPFRHGARRHIDDQIAVAIGGYSRVIHIADVLSRSLARLVAVAF